MSRYWCILLSFLLFSCMNDSGFAPPAFIQGKSGEALQQAMTLYDQAFGATKERRNLFESAAGAFASCRKRPDAPAETKATALFFEADSWRQIDEFAKALELLESLIADHPGQKELAEMACADKLAVMLLADSGLESLEKEAVRFVERYPKNPSAAEALLAVAARTANDRIKWRLSRQVHATAAPDSAVSAEALMQMEKARNSFREASMIRTWQLLGPMNSPWSEAFFLKQRPFESQKRIDLAESQEGFAWTKAKDAAVSKDGHVMFEVQWGDRTQCTAYALAWVQSPEERNCKVFLGSDDAFKVWVNGELRGQEFCGRGAAPDQSTVDAVFRKGWNQLLLQVFNGYGPWGFYCRIADGEEFPCGDFVYSCEMPK